MDGNAEDGNMSADYEDKRRNADADHAAPCTADAADANGNAEADA